MTVVGLSSETVREQVEASSTGWVIQLYLTSCSLDLIGIVT